MGASAMEEALGEKGGWEKGWEGSLGEGDDSVEEVVAGSVGGSMPLLVAVAVVSGASPGGALFNFCAILVANCLQT